MIELLRDLDNHAIALDLGSREGSFRRDLTRAIVIRLDRETPTSRDALFVRADAAHLPFKDQSVRVVIANHSFEHFDDLPKVLTEIRRVISPNGALFVSVPDASTLTDRLYRWLARGGGHVNPFTDPQALADAIENATGLQHIATKTLYSSLSFLNRRNSPGPPSKKLRLLGGGSEWSLFSYVWLSRRIDRILKVRSGVYGWAFYFGSIATEIDMSEWKNVCIGCGGGAPAEQIRQRSRNMFGIRVYRCEQCGTTNPFTPDS